MTKKKKAILFFTGFAIAVAASFWYWHNKHDVRYEVIYPLDSDDHLILGEHGEIVGSELNDPDNAFFIWEPTKGITNVKRPKFPGLPEFRWYITVDMNTFGHIVGCCFTSQEKDQHAFLWTPEKGIVLLGDLGGGWSDAAAINDQGIIVGASKTENGKRHAFMWEQEKGMTDLTPDEKGSIAIGINNSGQVTGQLATLGSVMQPFIWDKSTGITRLEISESMALSYGINDTGQVIGNVFESNMDGRLFVWDRQKGTQLFKFAMCTTPRINNDGLIALTTRSKGFPFLSSNPVNPQYRPYLGHIDGEFVLLYNLLPDIESLENICILDMNDRGELLIRDRNNQPALLRPIQKRE